MRCLVSCVVLLVYETSHNRSSCRRYRQPFCYCWVGVDRLAASVGQPYHGCLAVMTLGQVWRSTHCFNVCTSFAGQQSTKVKQDQGVVFALGQKRRKGLARFGVTRL